MEEPASEKLVTILADHNVEGQADVLWGVLLSGGWLEISPARLVRFADVGLSDNATDRAVWRFAQTSKMLLLTGNRRMKGDDSLEQTIRDENHVAALPVVTIARVERLIEPDYRERCAVRLLDIASEIDRYRGVGRLFIP
ncbi:MAG: hypothetical protein WD894_17575 [Pirellulales bacterium]